MATRQEIMREIDRLNKNVQDTSLRKEEVLLDLGIYIYQKVREGLLNNDEINEKCKPIIGFDHVIYDAKLKINELKKEIEPVKCSCGAVLKPSDRFCGKCGQKVEISVDSTEYIECEICLSQIDKDSKYCPCCGTFLKR